MVDAHTPSKTMACVEAGVASWPRLLEWSCPLERATSLAASMAPGMAASVAAALTGWPPRTGTGRVRVGSGSRTGWARQLPFRGNMVVTDTSNRSIELRPLGAVMLSLIQSPLAHYEHSVKWMFDIIYSHLFISSSMYVCQLLVLVFPSLDMKK